MLGKLPERIAAAILDTPRWKFLTVLFAIMFLRTGVTPVAPQLVAVAKDPFTLPWTDPYQHYLFWSWLGPFLAHLVHMTTKLYFTLFYVAFSIGFSVLMVRWLFSRLDEPRARVAVLVFALLPASVTSYYWIWTDSLTLFLLACALYFPTTTPRNYPVLLVLGIGLGMQHFEQGAFAAASATFALAWAARRGHKGPFTWSWAATLLVGAIAGKAILVAIFAHYEIHVNSGRWFWLVENWALMLKRFAYSFHASVFATFGVAWFVVIGFLRRSSPAARPAGVALFGLMLLLPISDDPTRVYAIVSFLVVCSLILTDGDFLATIDRPALGRLALAWVVIPFVFVWAGKAMVAATGYNALASVHSLFHTAGTFQDPRVPF